MAFGARDFVHPQVTFVNGQDIVKNVAGNLVVKQLVKISFILEPENDNPLLIGIISTRELHGLARVKLYTKQIGQMIIRQQGQGLDDLIFRDCFLLSEPDEGNPNLAR